MQAPPHFHFHSQWIVARSGSNAARTVAAYMHRSSPAQDVGRYMSRARAADAGREAEVAHSFFFANGLEIDAAGLWVAVDQLSRNKKTGDYKSHAGRMPRLGFFIDASLPYDVSLDDAIEASERFALGVVEKYGCAVEGVIHFKDGRYDHAHFLIVDRRVGPEGISRGKIRGFNGVAMKAAGAGVVDGGRVVAPAMEFMRERWAAKTHRISGNQGIDHRSYARQGLELKPVEHVRRGQIEFENRRGIAVWKQRRERELAARIPSVRFQIPIGHLKKRASLSATGKAAATAILSEKIPANISAILAHKLQRIGKQSAMQAAALAKTIADNFEQQSSVPLPAPTALPNFFPKKRRKCVNSASTMIAAAYLSGSQESRAANGFAAAVGRVTGQSRLATSVFIKLIGPHLDTKLDAERHDRAAKIQATLSGGNYGTKKIPDYVHAAKSAASRLSTSFSGARSGGGVLSAALSISMGNPLPPSVRSQAHAGINISAEIAKRNPQSHAEEEEIRNQLIQESLARQVELSDLEQKAEDERLAKILTERAEKQRLELLKWWLKPRVPPAPMPSEVVKTVPRQHLWPRFGIVI